MAATEKDGPAEEKPKGFLGRVFGGSTKHFKKAKMGKALEMYYNEEVGFLPFLKFISTTPTVGVASPHSHSILSPPPPHTHTHTPQLKCWVMPGEEEEKKKEIGALTAPPPHRQPTHCLLFCPLLGHAPPRNRRHRSSAGGGRSSPTPTTDTHHRHRLPAKECYFTLCLCSRLFLFII